MKKLLSIVLAVAVLATMAFSMMVSTASAEDASYSLLPKTADKFEKAEGASAGDGTITITAQGAGYKFESTQGWPAATFVELDEATQTSWVNTKAGSGSTLNYDFEVVSGKAAMIVYFCGQNPKDMASMGSFVSINGLVNKAYVDPLTGDAKEDIPVGKYKASVSVDDLGYRDDLKGDNGEMKITGVKIFAVGGTVIVNDVSVTDKSGADNSKHANKLGAAVENPVQTTGAQSDATTTVAKTTAKAGTDSAKTGDTTNAIVFIAVAAVAAGAVVVTAKKQKAR